MTCRTIKHSLWALSLLTVFQVNISLAEEQSENKQAMASSPAELIKILENASFLQPDEYDKKLQTLRTQYQHSINVPIIPQVLNEKTDPRNTILATDIEKYSMKLVEFSQRSKDDGNILWGRIQGTEYERDAHKWIKSELTSIGLKDVHYDESFTQYPQWTPSKIDLKITHAPGFSADETYRFDNALTAFVSATTTEAGVDGELIYVGDGTPSELSGRNLEGKIVLLRGRTQPAAILNTARTAYARLATGKWGKPAGIVVWWDVPFAKQVAVVSVLPAVRMVLAKRFLGQRLAKVTVCTCGSYSIAQHQKCRLKCNWLYKVKRKQERNV